MLLNNLDINVLIVAFAHYANEATYTLKARE